MILSHSRNTFLSFYLMFVTVFLVVINIHILLGLLHLLHALMNNKTHTFLSQKECNDYLMTFFSQCQLDK